MKTLDQITNPITYINANLVAFFVTLRQGNEAQRYRKIISGLLPEANQQYKKSKDTTNFILDRWDSINNDEIKIISKLLKRSIKLSEWSLLIAGLILVTTGSASAILVHKLRHEEIVIKPEISDCVEDNNCIIILELANVDDLYSPDFEAGNLTVKFTTSGTPDDILSIRNQGTDTNDIGVDSNNITYGDTIIGSFEGGKEAQPLVITFNANANREIVQAVVRKIAYSNISKNPTIGKRTVEFQLTDGDGGISNTLTENIHIIPNTDNLKINVPSATTVNENTDLAITDISLTAAESQNVTVTLEVNNGAISVKPDVSNGLTADAITNNKTSKVTLTGTVTEINTTLADTNSITYKGNQNFTGEDSLALSVNINNTEKGLIYPPSDQNLQPVSQNINITVKSLNPPPIVNVPSSKIVNQNTNLSINGISISSPSSKNITITLSVANGILTIKDNLPEGLRGNDIKNNKTNTVTLTGDIAKINNILADSNGIIYRGNQDYYGEDSLNVIANDGKNGTSKSIDITVNDNPVISVPEFVKTSDGTIITKPDAVNVIQSWLLTKSEVLGPSYDFQILEKYTINEYLERQKGSVEWLIKYNAYYTYGGAAVEAGGKFYSKGNQIIIETKVAQDRTLHINGGIDPTNSGLSTGVYRWTLQWENGSFKIANSEEIKN